MDGEHASPRPEPGIGRSLQKAREERGFTLRQVEQRTKIRSRYLQDLERENFGVLPPVYVLGSLKTYADHLGLDGGALSAELKRRLVPDEPETLAEERTKPGNVQDAEDEYEAAPLLTAGFDHLFLGMGLVLISALAVMTLVFVLATGDQPAVSHILQPSTPEASSEISLAGNVLEKLVKQPRAEAVPPKAEGKEEDGNNTNERVDRPGNGPGASKDEDGKNQPERDAQDAAAAFDNAEFVPLSPSSPPAAGVPSTNASPPPAATSSAAPVSEAPPTASASAGAASSSAAPAAPESDDDPISPAPATVGASSPAPYAGGPAPSPAPSVNPSGRAVPPEADGGGYRAVSPVRVAETDRISARVEARVDGALQRSGLVR